jgi:hypothetical protein
MLMLVLVPMPMPMLMPMLMLMLMLMLVIMLCSALFFSSAITQHQISHLSFNLPTSIPPNRPVRS